MKKWKRFAVLGLSMVMMAGTLVGCGSSASASSTSSTSTLSKVISDQKLKVGVITAAPFGQKNTDGEFEGYDIDIANLLADSLGVKVELQELTADARVSALETGKVDIVLADFTSTLERYQKISFSDPYSATGVRLLTRSDDNSITSLSDCAGKTVALLKGSANAEVCQNYMEENNIQFDITYIDQNEDCIAGLQNKQFDAFMEDGQYLEYIASQYPEDLKVVGDSITALTYIAAGLPKGDSDWKDYVDDFIFTINTDGSNTELYKKWFGTESEFKLNPDY